LNKADQTVELAVYYRGLALEKRHTHSLVIACSLAFVVLLYLGLAKDSGYLLWIMALPIAVYIIRHKLLDRKFPNMFKSLKGLKSKLISQENYYKGVQKVRLEEDGICFPPCVSKKTNVKQLNHAEIKEVTRYYRSCTNKNGDYLLKNYIFILDDTQKETSSLEFLSVNNERYLIPSSACDTHPIELYIKHHGYKTKEQLNKAEAWTVRAIMAPMGAIFLWGSYFSFLEKSWFTAAFLGSLATSFLFIIYRSSKK
jgi:hypothetical protein